jgi:hypothetical protein
MTTTTELETEAAKLLQTIEEAEAGTAVMFFINRDDILDYVETDEADEPMRRLQEQTGARPHFQVCTLINGQLTDSEANEIYRPFIVSDITPAITAARQERERFYAERADIYGAAAYPRG